MTGCYDEFFCIIYAWNIPGRSMCVCVYVCGVWKKAAMVRAGGVGWMRGSRCPTELMDLSKEWMALNENLCVCKRECVCARACTSAIFKILSCSFFIDQWHFCQIWNIFLNNDFKIRVLTIKPLLFDLPKRLNKALQMTLPRLPFIWHSILLSHCKWLTVTDRLGQLLDWVTHYTVSRAQKRLN